MTMSDEMREGFHAWLEISTKDALFAESDRWLDAHDAEVRADQIAKDAGIALDRAGGPESDAFAIVDAIRAQLTEGETDE